jgi:hypothetical protein
MASPVYRRKRLISPTGRGVYSLKELITATTGAQVYDEREVSASPTVDALNPTRPLMSPNSSLAVRAAHYVGSACAVLRAMPSPWSRRHSAAEKNIQEFSEGPAMLDVAPFPKYEIFSYPPPDCETVELGHLSAAVAEQCARSGENVNAEQVRESLGGIANLYMARLLEADQPQLRICTESAVASELVPETAVITEIQNCAGLTRARAERVFNAIGYCIKSEFRKRSMDVLHLEPLGRFEPIDLESSRYQLTFKDPACEDHGEFI